MAKGARRTKRKRPVAKKNGKTGQRPKPRGVKAPQKRRRRQSKPKPVPKRAGQGAKPKVPVRQAPAARRRPVTEPRVELAGSSKTVPSGARLVGPADAGEQIEVTVFLRHGSPPSSFPDVEQLGALPMRERRPISREEFAARHGSSAEDLQLIREFAVRRLLRVVAEHPERRSVVLSGTAGSLGRAFGVRLRRFEQPQGIFRGHTEPLRIPAHLAGIILGVFGLDNRPQARPHFRRAERTNLRPAAATQGYTPLEVAALYKFPAGLDGAGQCIGILELGGGYRPADLSAYFSGLGLTAPNVVAIGVDGAANQPTGDPNGPDAEVALDIEVAGAVAPVAKLAVYFAPNTSQGFLDALTTAVHDTANRPDVISISWGAAEADWDQQSLQALNSACQDAAAMGITVCVASGDSGSSDGVGDGQPHVDFPAASPYALACGGTRLTITAGQIAAEVVWNDLPNGGASGGGVSVSFALPGWQRSAKIPAAPNGQPGRGVPDVAADADPATGYQILVDGQSGVIGGTSAAAPLWAGLLARFNQRLGKPAGFLNPLLYASLPTDILNDITQGNNGAYRAGPDWDACTGLGSPNGARLATLLS